MTSRNIRRALVALILPLLVAPVSALDRPYRGQSSRHHYGQSDASLDQAPLSDAVIRKMVSRWYSLYEHNASIDRYVAMIGDPSVESRFRRDFVENIRRFRLLKASLRSVAIRPAADGSRQVEMDLDWSAKTREGAKRDFTTHEVWRLFDDGTATPRIASYSVEGAN